YDRRPPHFLIFSLWSAAPWRRFRAFNPSYQPSSRPERPDFFLRADFWRVGPRSAACALRPGGGISLLPSPSAFPFCLPLLPSSSAFLFCLPLLPSSSAGCPTRRVCVWVLGSSSPRIPAYSAPGVYPDPVGEAVRSYLCFFFRGSELQL